MKFRIYGMGLGLFFAAGLVFSFSIGAFGTHGDSTITAQEVADDPGNETKMKEFVNRIVNYYEHVRAENMNNRAALIRELTIFARELRREGDYKHGDIYAMGITENSVVTNHAQYPELIGYKVNRDAGTPLADTLKALLDNSAVGATNCAEYGQSNERVACAAKIESDLTVDVTNIAGLHHEADFDNLDAAFEEPDCSGLTLGTTAESVFNDPTDANLEAYVKDVIEAIQEDVAKISNEEAGRLISQDPSLLKDLARLAELAEGPITTRIQERLFCFGSGDFKHGNIYIFVMGADLEESTVIVNGNNFDLNGGNLELEDDELEGEDKTIAGLFNRELAGGTTAYVNYRWDDPLDTEDGIENWFEMGSVPGTSPKRSYIEVANLYKNVTSAPAQLYIFGSGTYPEPEEDDGGGACAIAGTGHMSQNTLLNLFLVASVLLPVVFLRKRA